MLTVGDKIRFYDGTMPMIGTISSISGDTVSVGGKSVPKESVFNVVERSSTAVGDDKSIMNDYFTRAYGNSDFANKLTKDMNSETGTMGTDTGFSGTVGGGKSKKK